VGSPNVPPRVASRIVQIDAAHAAIRTVVAITANKADSRRNKEHQAVLPIPYPIRLGSPNVPARKRSRITQPDAAHAATPVIITVPANKADNTGAMPSIPM